MSLLGNIRRNVKALDITSTFTTTESPGFDYLDNGYFGIYRTAYGGYSSALGYGITEDRALSLAPVLCCVKIISEDVASLPLFVNERVSKTSIQLAADHPLYKLLHDAPNPDMTAMQFREALTVHALLCGNAYARIERSKGDPDRIIALWPILPNAIKVDKDRTGRKVFIHTEMNGLSRTLTKRDVFHLSGFTTTGEFGTNVLYYAREAIGLGIAQQQYASRFFSQDQTPPIVLTHPGELGPEGVAAVKQAWKEHHQGADKWHTPAVLQEAMQIQQLKPNARESQMNEQRTYQLLEVCRLFRMPPHKIGEMGRATWGNISEQNTSYYNETLRPWLVRWEQSANQSLLNSDDRYYVEHEIAGLLRGDFKTQTEGFRTLLASGVYSINEVRGYLNLNPIEGGDEHFIQINQGTVQAVADQFEDVNNPLPAPDDTGKVVVIGGTK